MLAAQTLPILAGSTRVQCPLCEGSGLDEIETDHPRGACPGCHGEKVVDPIPCERCGRDATSDPDLHNRFTDPKPAHRAEIRIGGWVMMYEIGSGWKKVSKESLLYYDDEDDDELEDEDEDDDDDYLDDDEDEDDFYDDDDDDDW